MENRKILEKSQRSKIKGQIFQKQELVSFIGIVGVAVIARLIPHPANFAPITGLALFSGVTQKSKKILLIPLVAMFVSDIFLGFHSTIPFVYGSFLLISVIGRVIKNRVTFVNLSLIGIFSSFLFFLITNFGVWLTSSMYTKNVSGLIGAYVMGIPFFRNTLMGDFVFTMSFFYGYKYATIFSSRLILLFKDK